MRTDLSNVGVYGESGVTDKTSLGAGLNYSDTTYDKTGFINSGVVSVPVDAYYSFSPKTDVSVGHKFTNSEQSDNAVNYDTNFVNVGLRGNFPPC